MPPQRDVGRQASRGAGRLPDADRESRGRHAARAQGARGGRPRSLRGHAADARSPRPPRRQRQARELSPPQRGRSNGRGAATPRSGRTGRRRVDRLPGVNDPGARLIAAAIEHGVRVTVLPGPSAVETALVASGLVGDRYAFVGYLPRRRDALDRLWEELSPGGPTVAFESPRRLPATLASLARRPRAARRGLPRADEALRGGRPRPRGGGRGPLRRAAEGRDHARGRPARSAAGRRGRGARRRGGAGRRGNAEAHRRRGRGAPHRSLEEPALSRFALGGWRKSSLSGCTAERPTADAARTTQTAGDALSVGADSSRHAVTFGLASSPMHGRHTERPGARPDPRRDRRRGTRSEPWRAGSSRP